MTTPEVSKTANKPPSCTVPSVYCFLAVAYLPQFPPCTKGRVQNMSQLGPYAPLAADSRLAPPTGAAVCTSPELLHALPSSLISSPLPGKTKIIRPKHTLTHSGLQCLPPKFMKQQFCA